MFWLDKLFNYSFFSPPIISIHLMFWLDNFVLHCVLHYKKYFNTSYVLVGPLHTVLVHTPTFYFNTSYVLVGPVNLAWCNNNCRISIHLMFWLDISLFKFFILNPSYFNTSYVLVGQETIEGNY